MGISKCRKGRIKVQWIRNREKSHRGMRTLKYIKSNRGKRFKHRLGFSALRLGVGIKRGLLKRVVFNMWLWGVGKWSLHNIILDLESCSIKISSNYNYKQH